MKMVIHYMPQTIVFGKGSLSAFGAQLERLDAKRVFIVTTRGMSNRPSLAILRQGLSGMKFSVWSGVPAEPGVQDLQLALDAARELNPDVIIGLGGGSAMDIAKLVAILLTNNDSVTHYFGICKVPKLGLPTVMIPTTSGSGSEVSPEAVLTDRSVGTKFAVKDPKLVPSCAIIDPLSTITCPAELTAICGFDALTHAIEAYTAKASNQITDFYALHAVALIWEHLLGAVTDGNNLDSRSGMALGAMMAGAAFSSTGTAAVHACGYPLSAFYGIPHGAANAVMLPHVIAFNQQTCNKYSTLESVFSTNDLPAALTELINAVGLQTQLRNLGVERKAIHKMALIAAEDDRHLSANPRAMTTDDLEAVFERAW